jgi:hypothetical protein
VYKPSLATHLCSSQFITICAFIYMVYNGVNHEPPSLTLSKSISITCAGLRARCPCSLGGKEARCSSWQLAFSPLALYTSSCTMYSARSGDTGECVCVCYVCAYPLTNPLSSFRTRTPTYFTHTHTQDLHSVRHPSARLRAAAACVHLYEHRTHLLPLVQ